nr:semaphorin-1A-like [Cherax quadricarinatus]
MTLTNLELPREYNSSANTGPHDSSASTGPHEASSKPDFWCPGNQPEGLVKDRSEDPENYHQVDTRENRGNVILHIIYSPVFSWGFDIFGLKDFLIFLWATSPAGVHVQPLFKTTQSSLLCFINTFFYLITDELESQIFPGNSSETDYFRLLQRDGDSLLIGARNIVYNISVHNLEENFSQRIVWFSKEQDSSMCFDKGKSVDECQNYIRVLAKEGEGRFLVCGTNAYKPLCRRYAQQTDGSFNFTETNGAGQCPYDPRHNSTFVYVDGELYSGTVADFQGTIPLIFRHPLKTDHNDYKQLNAPDFVHSFDYGDFVFFFFRETAVEYMNCGKRVYSRVARVCKGDRGGGQQRFKLSWTSFLKSRLNCSVPGDYPFYFDEIQSTTDVISGVYGGESHKIIYAVFTTPPNSIPGSAVCAFSMRAILDTFEGSFKEQETINSNWLPVRQSEVPEPRPGSCVEDSQTLPEHNVNFAKDHPLMDEAVPAFFSQPLLMKASFEYRFSKMVVDPQVTFLDGKTVDVLFIATDNGIIFKAINTLASEGIK